MLFLRRGMAPRLRELARAAPAQPLLVVCEWDGALDQGAAINFVAAEAACASRWRSTPPSAAACASARACWRWRSTCAGRSLSAACGCRAFIRRSLRGKMTAVVLATTFVALLVNALALLYYNAVTLRDSQIADVRTQAEILGRASAAALAFNDRKEAGRDLATLKARPDIEAAALYAADGTLFASYTRNGIDARLPPRAAEAGLRIADDRVTLIHPIVEGGETVGRVYMRAQPGPARAGAVLLRDPRRGDGAGASPPRSPSRSGCSAR